ncbi:MAG: type II toxin-antitoxin system HicB family antitoxin [Candidatus Hydrogenedentes bacterium]|nr:type II toxin-antitoxin system HicB family antitoxin [Candidatus Hydrogenedentota bacterium]
MTHKGYVGSVEYEDDDELFHGTVVGIKDTVTFAGKSVRELKKAFRDSVDEYLAFCAKRREEPDKPYSGEFRLRLEPELHRDLALAAARARQSLNGFIVQAVRRAVAAHE